MDISVEELEACIPLATDRAIKKFYTPLCDAMEEFEINSPRRIAAFLAQIAHESGNLAYTEELASGCNYEFRGDLGNLSFEALQIAHSAGSTTGKFYKGRGLIMCTGYFNYLACSKALNVDYLNYPKLLSNPIDACRSSAWFWYDHHCNELADKGLFKMITKRINGGLNGKVSRDINYARCKKVLGL